MNEFGSEYDWQSKNICLSSKKKNDVSFFSTYRSCREALNAIAKNIHNDYSTIMVPALSCTSMIIPFVKENFNIIFYPITINCKADLVQLEKLVPNHCAFLYVNYFGQQMLDDITIRVLKEKECLLIEDRTHDFLKNNFINCKADYTVCSIRKWMMLPDGAFLLHKNFLKANADDTLSPFFVNLRTEAMKRKSEYLTNGNKRTKEMFLHLFKESNDILENFDCNYQMSEVSKEIFEFTDLSNMYNLRLSNVSILEEELIFSNNIKKVPFSVYNSTLYYPILCNHRDELQKKLANNGVYCPVIWPLYKDAENICENSNFFANHILAIPCDHRYSELDMKYIANIINTI